MLLCLSNWHETTTSVCLPGTDTVCKKPDNSTVGGFGLDASGSGLCVKNGYFLRNVIQFPSIIPLRMTNVQQLTIEWTGIIEEWEDRCFPFSGVGYFQQCA